MFNTVEKQSFSNISATTANFTLRGGLYGVDVHATAFNAGSVTLQKLANDGVTFVTCLAAFSVDGYGSANLPSGTYRFAVSLATGVFIALTSI
jgi:hypothetical protein